MRAGRPFVGACDVLHVAWSGEIGGIETQVAAIARHARARAAAAHVVCLLAGRGPVGDALVAEGLGLRLGLRVGWDPRGLWRLWRVLRRLRPQVVHSQTHALGANLVAWLAVPRAVRAYTEQSPRALGPDLKFRVLYGLLRRTEVRMVALSPAMARAMEDRGADPDRLAVVPNAVPIPLRPPPAPRRAAPTVGVVARLEPQKRVDVLLDVLAALRGRGLDCRGLVVGHGTLAATLADRARMLGLGAVVHFAGWQTDVVPWLDRMDVFFMTSAAEPYGVAALEAMARGVPVVAMPCPGGLGDIVSGGGLLLADREVGTAASALSGLLGSTDARRDLAARGAATAAEHRVECVVERLERVYGIGSPVSAAG